MLTGWMILPFCTASRWIPLPARVGPSYDWCEDVLSLPPTTATAWMALSRRAGVWVSKGQVATDRSQESWHFLMPRGPGKSVEQTEGEAGGRQALRRDPWEPGGLPYAELPTWIGRCPAFDQCATLCQSLVTASKARGRWEVGGGIK